jgi:hypothetical protein
MFCFGLPSGSGGAHPNHRERRVTTDHIRHLACRNRLSTATGKHFRAFSYGEISQG